MTITSQRLILAVFLFQLKQLETELGKIEKAIASFKLAE